MRRFVSMDLTSVVSESVVYSMLVLFARMTRVAA